MIIFKVAHREIRNNFRKWIFFCLNLLIGLIGFTFIFLFRESISTSLEYRAKSLLTADIAITGRRDLSQEEGDKVSAYLQDKIKDSAFMTEIYSMAKGSSQRSRLVHIKSIKGRYPLVGSIKLKDQSEIDAQKIANLNENLHVIISKEVAHQFKIDINDSLKIGKLNYKVINIIENDSTSSMRGFNLAPSVYIGQSKLKETGLIGFGTVAWYSDFYLLNNDKEIDQIKENISQKITDPAIKIRTPKSSSQQMGRVLNYLSDYLGLIGVVAFLISLIGSSYLFQSHLIEKLKQLGILKSLGVSIASLMGIYFLLILYFGSFSALAALGISYLLLPFATGILQNWMPGLELATINFDIIFTIISISVVINILVSFPILRRVFRTPTNNLLNGLITTRNNIFLYLPALLFVWGLSVWQAHSFKIGSVFTFALVFIFAVVFLIVPRLFKRVGHSLKQKKLTYPQSLNFGMGIRFLTRNSFTSVLTILSLTIGISLLTLIVQLDKSLKAELTSDNSGRPSLFLFDIQEEQFESLVEHAKVNNYPLAAPTPMVRARLLKKNGEVVKRQDNQSDGFQTREEEASQRFNNRGVNLSYGDGFHSSNEIIAGKPFSGKYLEGEIAEVSLEQRYARRLGVGIGDTLTYDVLGVEIQGKVVSLRKIKWTSFVPNFFIVFQPGVLEIAPKTYLAAVEKVTLEEQLKIQDLIVDKFPNISILNVSELISKILTLFTAMAWAVGVMSICCLAVGIFVLFSIMQNQIQQKEKDFFLQRLIGRTSGEIFKSIFIEFMAMVTISLILGIVIGLGLSYTVSYLFLDGIFVLDLKLLGLMTVIMYLFSYLSLKFIMKKWL